MIPDSKKLVSLKMKFAWQMAYDSELQDIFKYKSNSKEPFGIPGFPLLYTKLKMKLVSAYEGFMLLTVWL